MSSSQPASIEVDETSAAVESRDVLELLRQDYQRAYFLTGNEECQISSSSSSLFS